MRALLYGSGAVGLGIAASLLDCGWEVDIKASGRTKDLINEKGVKRVGLFKEIDIPASRVKVFERLSDIPYGEYDFILICIKSVSNEESALDLSHNKNLLKAHGKIVIFQNGWGTDESYLRYFDKSQVYSARVITGFSRPERNISEVTVHSSPILIGSLYNQPADPVKSLADAITQGGIPCETTNEIHKALWAKMLYNCALNPLGAILNVCYGRLAECESSIFIMNQVIEEIFAVMTAAGYQTYWRSANEYQKAFYGELIPSTYSHRSSTLQDIEKKNKTEIDSLNGSIVRLGKKLGISTPYNTMLYNLIKAKESYF
ncbi:MAG: ketopantoate reductase family protein [Clostridiales bacterium]|jgi:2-dehydropantoate 2-reductase|nr:ketopantoate reductase family protein [Eubacteriales bacterium]MDH7567727.1 ketopantoate reductase family protein [Clostridiales bacterium]